MSKFHNFQILREINFFRPHGPPMLAWMLSHYLVDRQVGKFKSLGERAFQLNVIEFLTSGLKSDALNSNHIIAAISHGVVFGLISILVTAFDPDRMGIETKLFDLILVLVKKEVIAEVVWKEGLDSNQGLSNYIGQILGEFPANVFISVKLLQALAYGSRSSASHVFDFLEQKEVFAEHTEEVQAHQICMKGDQAFMTTVQRQKNGIYIPDGTYGSLSLDGKFYQWKFSYGGFQILFNEVESILNQIGNDLFTI